MHGAGDVRMEEVPDPTIQEPTDAVVRVVRSGVCGSDLWAYGSMPASEQGRPMGHEFLGVMEDLGAEVSGLKRGDLVVTPGPARRSATCSPQWVIADNATLADGIATAPFLTDPPRLNETDRFYIRADVRQRHRGLTEIRGMALRPGLRLQRRGVRRGAGGQSSR